MQGDSFKVLTAALDGLAARQRAIAANIANGSTPGYKRMTVSFEDQLESAKKGMAIEPKYERDDSPGGPDGNNVDSAIEVGQLTRVELTYQVIARAVSMESNQLRAAISGRAGEIRVRDRVTGQTDVLDSRLAFNTRDKSRNARHR